MYLNQNIIASFTGVSSGTSHLVFGAFNFEKMRYTDKEVWRSIPGYEGYYDISSHGNGISLKRNIIKKSGERYPIRGISLKLLIDNLGYYRFNLYINCRPTSIMVHQLVAMAFLGYVRNGKYDIVVDHIDNISLNNYVSNIQLISARGNSSKDQYARGCTSKYVGVCFDKSRSKWASAIVINKKVIKIGRFQNEIDAHNAYQDILWELPDTGRIIRYSQEHDKIFKIQATRGNYNTLIRTKDWNILEKYIV